MHRKSSLLGVALLGAAAWTVARAQTDKTAPCNTCVAVVNMTTVFEKAQMVQDLERIFGQERQRIQTEADERRDKLNSLQKELDSGAFAKESTDYQERLDQLEQLKMDRELWMRKQERLLLTDHKSYFEQVYKRISQACEDVAKVGGIDVVLSDNPVDFAVPESAALVTQILQKKVVYAGPQVDLTPDVLARFDAEYVRDGGAAIIKLAK